MQSEHLLRLPAWVWQAITTIYNRICNPINTKSSLAYWEKAQYNSITHPLVRTNDPTVRTAGIIEFRAGKIYKVDNVSGHFKPSAQSLLNSQPLFKLKIKPILGV